MVSALEKRPGQRAKRPTPAASLAAIRRMGYQGEVQRQITNGWWARGHENAANEEKYGSRWMPDLGDTDDVFIQASMSTASDRESLTDGQVCGFESPLGEHHVGCRQTFVMLSDVPNKRAVPRRPTTGEFVIEPPEYDQLDEILELMRRQLPESIAYLEEQIQKNEEILSDSGSLMKGEAPQLRTINRRLKERIKRLQQPSTFATLPIYTAMVNERMQVLKAQQGPATARHAELQREYDEWAEHLRLVEAAGSGEPPETGSASSTKPSTSTTPRAKAN